MPSYPGGVPFINNPLIDEGLHPLQLKVQGLNVQSLKSSYPTAALINTLTCILLGRVLSCLLSLLSEAQIMSTCKAVWSSLRL